MLLDDPSKDRDRFTVVQASRFAAIDIGTVTCRLLVADAFATELPSGHLDIKLMNVAKEYAVTNLGEGVDATHRLSADAIERVADALQGFKRTMAELSDEEYPIQKVSVMSTSAARDAENSDVFASRLAQLGFGLDIIPGSEEASLSFSGATIKRIGDPAMVVDVGGGSTEVSFGIGGQAPVCSRSFNIGCRRVTERFFTCDPPSFSQLEEARRWIRSQFNGWIQEKAVRSQLEGHPSMLAVAGTATSAVSIRERMDAYDPEKVDGASVSLGQLRDIEERLSLMTLCERREVVGLDPRRAPVIVAGMIILEEAMIAFGQDRFYASESDILEGMILDSAKRSMLGEG